MESKSWLISFKNAEGRTQFERVVCNSITTAVNYVMEKNGVDATAITNANSDPVIVA